MVVVGYDVTLNDVTLNDVTHLTPLLQAIIWIILLIIGAILLIGLLLLLLWKWWAYIQVRIIPLANHAQPRATAYKSHKNHSRTTRNRIQTIHKPRASTHKSHTSHKAHISRKIQAIHGNATQKPSFSSFRNKKPHRNTTQIRFYFPKPRFLFRTKRNFRSLRMIWLQRNGTLLNHPSTKKQLLSMPTPSLLTCSVTSSVTL